MRFVLDSPLRQNLNLRACVRMSCVRGFEGLAAESPTAGAGSSGAAPDAAPMPIPERFVAIVDIGGSSSSMAVAGFSASGARTLAVVHNATLGADAVHHRLFEQVAAQCHKKHGVTLVPGSRAGGRALRECEKAKKVCDVWSVCVCVCGIAYGMWGVGCGLCDV
jgi:hypothetical protein